MKDEWIRGRWTLTEVVDGGYTIDPEGEYAFEVEDLQDLNVLLQGRIGPATKTSTPYRYAIVQYADIGNGETAKLLSKLCSTQEEASEILKCFNYPTGMAVEEIVSLETRALVKEKEE